MCFNCIEREDIDLKVRQVIADEISGIDLDDVFLSEELRGETFDFEDVGISALSVPLSRNDGVFQDIPELEVLPEELVPFAGDGVKTVGDISLLIWKKIPSEKSNRLVMLKIISEEKSVELEDLDLSDELRGEKLNFTDNEIQQLSILLSQEDAIVKNLTLSILSSEILSATTVGDIAELVWVKIPNKQC